MVNIKNKRPRGHIAHLSNIGHNSIQLEATLGIKDKLSSLKQTVES